MKKWRIEGSNHKDGDDDDSNDHAGAALGGTDVTWTVLDVRNEPRPSLEARAFSQAAFKVAQAPVGGVGLHGAAASAGAGAAGTADEHDCVAAAGGAGGAGYYRRFRLLQTGFNSDQYDTLFCAGIELYGTLCCWEQE